MWTHSKKLLHTILDVSLATNGEQCAKYIIDCSCHAMNIVGMAFQRCPVEGVVIASKLGYWNRNENHQQASQQVFIFIRL